MTVGTKSLLFGVHQIFWHPFTVLLAWIWLYRSFPNLKELICIIIHDWGYWGCADMDGASGVSHPRWAAKFALRHLDREISVRRYFKLCLFHSRHYSRFFDELPSKLCWADKASVKFDPWWFYLPRAWMSGELKEYRLNSMRCVCLKLSNRTWYKWAQKNMILMAKQQSASAMPYTGEKPHIIKRKGE